MGLFDREDRLTDRERRLQKEVQTLRECFVRLVSYLDGREPDEDGFYRLTRCELNRVKGILERFK